MLADLAGLQPVLAHGVGGRSDLPLPLWQVAFGAGVAVVMSFAVAGIFVSRARLAGMSAGRPLPAALDRALTRVAGPVARLVGLVLLVVVIVAGLAGNERSPDFPVATNIAPVAFYIVFWQVTQALSAVLGNVWSVLSPFDTLARLGERLGVVPAPAEDPGPAQGARSLSAAVATSAPDEAEATEAAGAGWPALIGIFGFLWLELAYHSNTDIRMLGAVILGYTVWVTGMVVLNGRAWLQRGEGFTVLFGLLAAIAPFHRGDDGRLRIRVPFSGLARVVAGPWTTVLVLTVLGGTSFDGFTRTQMWADLTNDETGWDLTIWATAGLVLFVLAAIVLFYGACWISGRVTGRHELDVADDHAPALVPIVLGYTVAHYFSNTLFEGQGFIRALSDPFGRGWDLFGTADHRINYLLVTTRTIAWVQVLSIVIGHIAGVLLSHDRSLERHQPQLALRSQYSLVAVMVVFTVGGLYLLSG